MSTTSIPSTSREYVYVTVSATGPDAGSLGSLQVDFAFKADASEPIEADWRTAEWAPGPTARVLVGPGSPNVLAEGTWIVWVRVSGGTEEPVRKAGSLKIT